MRHDDTTTALKGLMAGGLLATLAAAPLAFAQSQGESDAAAQAAQPARVAVRQPQMGEKTRRLLELQRSGRIAAADRQSLPGEVQTRVYERYVESFSHAIPETYIDLEFGE